ncbi:4-hydroxy-tetrahydrodipicolinate reductase [Pseudoflavonifractor intestinihominis]|uniref:4-hydroxy-tetrahydrodipicolinate reductase n=1 Tax=Pseudoflavonifractor intestinihominis TaxID=3133171 RepID=A0ABV1EA46_9FIRM|nr:4-hydroxy-tetrahydrodipicolinate reductase [uncultured Pseudoflavonifractor sp.]
MLRIGISGCNGHMGRVVEDICRSAPDIEIAVGFDILGTCDRDFKVCTSPAEFDGEVDAVIDFSSPAALQGLLEFGTTRKVPLVLATTGYSQEQLTAIDEAAKLVPIFRSGNMSLGINVLLELVRRAASILGSDYDVEIVERHHHRKVDAPSGTALMIADAAASALPYQPQYVYERQSVRKPRDPHEIGISSVRGGTIVGDHEIIFAGRDEVIELRHSAQSREVFAAGAVKAARFLAGVEKPGLYSMADLVAAAGLD